MGTESVHTVCDWEGTTGEHKTSLSLLPPPHPPGKVTTNTNTNTRNVASEVHGQHTVPPKEKQTKLSMPLLCGTPPALLVPPTPGADRLGGLDGVPAPAPPPPSSSLTARAAAAAPGVARDTTGDGARDPRRGGRNGVTGERGRDPAFAVGAATVGTGTKALPR